MQHKPKVERSENYTFLKYIGVLELISEIYMTPGATQND